MMDLQILLYIAAAVGILFLLFLFYFIAIEPWVERYQAYQYRKTREYWEQQITDKQFNWQCNANYNEHVRFTMDFLSHYKKSLKEK